MAEILKIYGTNKAVSGRTHSNSLEWYVTNETKSPSQKLLRSKNDKQSQRKLKIKLFLFSLSFLLIIIQAGCTNGDISGKILAGLAVSILNTFHSHLYVMRMKAPEVANFINSLIQFDKMVGKKPRNILTRPFGEMLEVSLAYMSLITSAVLPFCFVFGLHWNHPWKASLAGFWLIPEPNDDETFSILDWTPRICVLLYNYWVWTFGLETTVFVTGVIHTLSPVVLLDNLGEFKKRCKGFHIFSINKRALIFREIQLLISMLNDIQRGPAILNILLAVILVSSFSLATLIKSSTMDSLFLVTLLIIVFDCMLVIVALVGGMSRVYIKSANILKGMRCSRTPLISRKGQQWEHKFYRSCNPLKIMITSTNFVDELAPLNTLQFSMALTANLLLLDH